MLIEDVNTQLKRTVTYVLDDVIDEANLNGWADQRSVKILQGSISSNNAMKTATDRRIYVPVIKDIETESESEPLYFGIHGDEDDEEGFKLDQGSSSHETGQSKSISWYVKYRKSKPIMSLKETESELDVRNNFSKGDHYEFSRGGLDSDRKVLP